MFKKSCRVFVPEATEPHRQGQAAKYLFVTVVTMPDWTVIEL